MWFWDVSLRALERFRSAAVRWLALATACLALAAVPAQSQNAGIVAPGNAIVTGFSGTIAAPAAPRDDPFDQVTINPDGPSAEVIDLGNLGPQGQLSDALKTFAVSSAEVGQVFGVTIDNAPRPNIYLAATSAYGLSIHLPDGTRSVRRIRVGTPGARFVPGQFGPPEYGGSPGSIWRIDGVSGEAYLFANINPAAVGAASLGGLAFDPASLQIFAVDRGTGIIHRLGLDGVERGTYDHGIEGRPPAGLAPLPYIPGPPVDINAPSFSTEAPSTWGFAPPGRRVFAVAVRNGRLYYSIAQGPQVWSVGIGRTGALAASPRLEVEVPALQDGIEIASIAFDGAGRMYIAERGPVTGDYELTRLASGGAARVLRYVPKPAGDPAPGLWRLLPDQYAIGFAPAYNNADGGVALGYGYRTPGAIDFNACRATLWSTGERLLDAGNGTLPPGYFQTVDGLQGNAPSLTLPQNAPPVNSWFVDYNDTPGNPDFHGHVGAVTIFSPCAAESPYVPPPPVITCPPGTVLESGLCVVTVTCPPGAVFKNGICVYQTCPPGYVLSKGQCIPPPVTCGPGFAFYDGRCVPLECPPGMQRMPNGQCICPVGNLFHNGKCVPPNTCPPGMVQSPNGICWCPAGTQYLDGQCIPNYCPNGYVTINGECVPDKCPPGYFRGPNGACIPIFGPCGPGEILVNGRCVPKVCPPGQQLRPDGTCHWIGTCRPGEIIVNGKCVPQKCPPYQELGSDGRCHPISVDCPKGMEYQNGKCVPKCRGDEHLVNGKCVPKPPNCKNNEELVNGRCVPKCRNNEHLVNGKCVPKPPKCKNDEELVNGKCVQKCGKNQHLVNGKCVAKPSECEKGEQLVNGKCVPACKKDEELVKGKCVPKKPNCKKGEQAVNGKCVPDCRKNEHLVNGKCVPKKSSSLEGSPGGPDLARLFPAWSGEGAPIAASPIPDDWRQATSAEAWSALRAVSRVPDTIICSTSCSLVSRM